MGVKSRYVVKRCLFNSYITVLLYRIIPTDGLSTRVGRSPVTYERLVFWYEFKRPGYSSRRFGRSPVTSRGNAHNLNREQQEEETSFYAIWAIVPWRKKEHSLSWYNTETIPYFQCDLGEAPWRRKKGVFRSYAAMQHTVYMPSTSIWACPVTSGRCTLFRCSWAYCYIMTSSWTIWASPVTSGRGLETVSLHMLYCLYLSRSVYAIWAGPVTLNGMAFVKFTNYIAALPPKTLPMYCSSILS